MWFERCSNSTNAIYTSRPGGKEKKKIREERKEKEEDKKGREWRWGEESAYSR
jgi:hypothetical protein